MKVLILADQPNWIIDRITDVMIDRIPYDFTKRYFGQMTGPELVSMANDFDLIHCQNVMDTIPAKYLECFATPFLMSVRSHRYNREVFEALDPHCDAIHLVNEIQKQEIPHGVYIPDGIMDQFMEKKPFVVGFAGHPDEYKGFPLIREACEREGVEFKPALTLPPDQMLDYYKSIDLYVCASIAEGHSTPVMECMAMNVPVITTDVGVPSSLNTYKMERTVQAIRRGIRRYNSQSQVEMFGWGHICKRFQRLYEDLV